MHEESPFHGIDVGSLSSPEVVDWDKDGLGDLIVGSDDGTLHFFRGSRYGTLVRAVSEQNPLHGIDTGAFISPEVVRQRQQHQQREERHHQWRLLHLAADAPTSEELVPCRVVSS